MTPREVYLEAACRIADQTYSGESWSCCIIGYVEGRGLNSFDSPLVQRYRRVFSPEGDTYDFAHEVSGFSKKVNKRDNLRVLMLTLMAACWRDFK